MSSIKKEIATGAFWIAVAKYSGLAIQLFISAILARLITPEEFGTVSIATVILYFLSLFSDIGLGPAVVQYKELTKYHLDSLFTLNVYIGLFLSLILIFSSGLISAYYGDKSLEQACQAMAVVLLFSSLNVVPSALMRKDKRFRVIAFSSLFFQIVSGIIAVWGAFNGWGLYSLLVVPIVSSIGVFIVDFYYYPLRLVQKISKEAISMVFSFSFFQFAFVFINYFSRNLDKLIIGKYFSMSQLGYYDKSYRLMNLPVGNITFVIEPVLHPILSSLQDNKHELAEKNLKLAKIISFISFPIGVILYYCGGELIKIVYGNQWDAAIPVFKILALSLPLQMIQSTSGAIYQAAGKTNHMFYNGIINTTITVGGFFIATIWGNSIESMAWAWVLTLLVNFIDSYYILVCITLKNNFCSFLVTLVPQLINSTCVFIMMSIFSDKLSIGIWGDLFFKITVIVFTTVILAYFLKQYNIVETAKRYYNLRGQI